jgi:prepilin-type N-terminal cleavage/methylation domain-containing protein
MKQGFTVIELFIVVIVVAILVGTSITAYYDKQHPTPAEPVLAEQAPTSPNIVVEKHLFYGIDSAGVTSVRYGTLTPILIFYNPNTKTYGYEKVSIDTYMKTQIQSIP